MLIFTLKNWLKLLISIETYTEHVPGTFGRGLIKGEVKIQSKSHPGKIMYIASLFIVYLSSQKFKFGPSMTTVPICYYYMINHHHNFFLYWIES